MPLYEYKCGECRHVFETLVSSANAEKSPVCPACGSDNCEKQFSVFASSAGRDAASSSAGGCGSCNSRFT